MNNYINCEFQVFTGEKNTNLVSKILGIQPTRQFNVGDVRAISSSSGKVGFATHGLWVLNSLSYVDSSHSIDKHIDALIQQIQPQIGSFLNLKNQYGFKFTFWIWMETDDAGIGDQISIENILAIGHLGADMRFSIICKKSLD